MCAFSRFCVALQVLPDKNHSTCRDVRIQSGVVGDDEVVAIACKVKPVLHHEAKMSFLPP